MYRYLSCRAAYRRRHRYRRLRQCVYLHLHRRRRAEALVRRIVFRHVHRYRLVLRELRLVNRVRRTGSCHARGCLCRRQARIGLRRYFRPVLEPYEVLRSVLVRRRRYLQVVRRIHARMEHARRRRLRLAVRYRQRHLLWYRLTAVHRLRRIRRISAHLHVAALVDVCRLVARTRACHRARRVVRQVPLDVVALGRQRRNRRLARHVQLRRRRRCHARYVRVVHRYRMAYLLGRTAVAVRVIICYRIRTLYLEARSECRSAHSRAAERARRHRRSVHLRLQCYRLCIVAYRCRVHRDVRHRTGVHRHRRLRASRTAVRVRERQRYRVRLGRLTHGIEFSRRRVNARKR